MKLAFFSKRLDNSGAVISNTVMQANHFYYGLVRSQDSLLLQRSPNISAFCPLPPLQTLLDSREYPAYKEGSLYFRNASELLIVVCTSANTICFLYCK